MWSWVLTAFGAATAWLIGSRHRIAWPMALLTQLVWTVYALATHQPGFLASVVIFGSIYIRNWHRATQDKAAAARQVEPEEAEWAGHMEARPDRCAVGTLQPGRGLG